MMLSHVRKRSPSPSPQNSPKRQKPDIVLHLSNNSKDISDWIANGSVDSAKLQKLEARLGTVHVSAPLQPEKTEKADKTAEKHERPRESSVHSGDSDVPTTQAEEDLLEHDTSLQPTPDQTPSTKKKKNFTEEEDGKIQQGYEQFNGDWEQVAKWGWPNGLRKAEQIKNRWKRLSKKKRPDEPEISAVLATAGSAYRIGAPLSSPPQLVAQVDKSSANASPSKGKTIYSYFPRETVPKHRPSEPSAPVTADIARLQESVLHLTQDKEDLVNQLTSVKQEAEQRIKAAEEGKLAVQERSRAVLVDLLLARARDKARDRRRRANENSMRLANMTVERRGLDMVERWEEGYEFQDLEDQIAKINKEKEDIEKKRKALTKQKTRAANDTPDKRLQRTDSMAVDASMVGEQEEIYKLRLATLKKEEADLQSKLHEVQGERDSHVREVRRIRDESASRFGNHPILSERYLLLELLGRGGFSEVWKAFDLVDMQVVAVKIHSLHSAWSDERKRSYTRHALREYQIHKQLVHPRIVRLFDVFEIDDSSFSTVLEYCDGNDLETHLQLQPNKVLSEREARSIIQQCFSALKYLNQLPQPVIHYDLKPGNLLFSHGQVRLTDFGLSKIVETVASEHLSRPTHKPRDIELTSQGAGTYWYLPPECFHRDGPALISSKVDVWSMGVIYYEMLFGVKPFGANQSQQSILRGDTITNEAHMVTFPTKPAVSQETKDFIRKCLEYRKERRPDVLTICSESYLNQK